MTTNSQAQLRHFLKDMSPSWLPEQAIFLTKAGSQAYGTSTPQSDLDLRGIAIPPRDILLGFVKSFEQAQKLGEVDIVVFDFRKFLGLASNCNPNIIEILFTAEEDWIWASPAYEKLRAHGHLFLSKKAQHTFFGYAMSQLKRIKSHRAWLLNPPKHKPSREEYGLSLANKVSASDHGAYDKLLEEGHVFDENVMQLLQREKAYANAMTEWKQYENWKNTRNEARASLEAKFSYDVKHGMHLVRLIRMGHEILSQGKVLVKRPDAEELKAIRQGAWTYDHMIEWATNMEQTLNEAAKASLLPESPDLTAINQLCIEILSESL